MISKSGDVPTSEEIRRQLHRMLRSERFSSNENPSKFLALVVEKALRNEPITQSIIGCELFLNRYQRRPISDVRVTKINLCKVLAEYYAEEGLEDFVIISLPGKPRIEGIKLPAGQAYKPIFAYNPRSRAQKEYLRGLAELARLDLAFADTSFTNAIKRLPTYADPYIALATIDMLAPMCPFTIVDQGASAWVTKRLAARKRLPNARRALAKALRLNPRLRRAHVLRAITYAYERRWNEAQHALKPALRISKTDTRNDPWYLAYLVASGNVAEPSRTLKASVLDRPDDANGQVVYGFLMYATRAFEEAEKAFQEAFSLSRPRFRAALIGYILVLLATGASKLALDMLEDIHKTYRFPTCFPGLFVLTLAECGKTSEARDRLSDLKRVRHLPPFQMALAYMGVNEMDKAVFQLSRACNDADPLTLWLHLWPIFDPLRNHQGFQKLIQRIKPPALPSIPVI